MQTTTVIERTPRTTKENTVDPKAHLLYENVLRQLRDMSHYDSAISLLSWDLETNMPQNAAKERSATIGFLTAKSHDAFLSSEFEEALAAVENLPPGSLDHEAATIIRETRRDLDKEKRLPSDLVERHASVCAESMNVWAEARKRNDFAMFQPHLTEVVRLTQEIADLTGPNAPRYDTLLDSYERGMTTERSAQVLGKLRDQLAGLLDRIRSSGVVIDESKMLVAAPFAKQQRINEAIAKKLGLDFESARLDISPHPFTGRMHAEDIRITTRYDDKDLLNAIGSTVHETGHALYERNLPKRLYGITCGEAPGMGIHESQSRLFENMIGKTRSFIGTIARIASAEGIELPSDHEEIYRAMNAVKPSLIRTEADEVTYNLHICIRFELERALIDGSLAVQDAPAAWNDAYKKYLGIVPPNDADGVMQDVHWSCGLFGYFPTYAFGNLYSAQLFEAATRAIPNLDEQLARDDYAPLLEWLVVNVHQIGGLKTGEEIIRDATGTGLDSAAFMRYLERKFGDIYKL